MNVKQYEKIIHCCSSKKFRSNSLCVVQWHCTIHIKYSSDHFKYNPKICSHWCSI